MQTLALNAAVIGWGVLLLFGPGLALALSGRLSAASLAGTSALTLVAISFVTYVAALGGYGTIGPLRVCVVILCLVLIWDTIQLVGQVRNGRRLWPKSSDAFALPVGLLIGIWVVSPPLMQLGRQGERFGLGTIFNPDLANYALAATNVASAGFRNSNHLAGADPGAFSHYGSYMGATALINFMSAATGLAAWQVAIAGIGCAVCLSAVALWALVKAVWPGARSAAAAAAVVASLASLPSHLVGQYLLGGVLGLTSAATSLAGATMLARTSSHPTSDGVLTLAAGGALGVYSYGHLGLPIVLLLPFWSMLAIRLSGRRALGEYAKVAAWSAGSVVLALALSAVAVPTAWRLVQSQRTAMVGYPLPPLSAESMLFWPPGILGGSSTAMLIGSWSVVLVVVVLAMAASWRRGFRDSVVISAVLTACCAAVAVGCVVAYGAERYQAWKMESFLLPMVLVVSIPALSALKVGRAGLGRCLMAASVGVVTLGPPLAWQAAIKRQSAPASPTAASAFTPAGRGNLANSRALARLSSVNIRLGSKFETMSAGSIVPTPVVMLSSPSYFHPPLTSLQTCTLTRLDMLSPGETEFTNLGGGYVLLRRPSKCAVKK